MSFSPRDRAESIRQRLRNRVRERGEDVQLALQRYAAERFLYRLGVSRHRERFVLKGAMLFTLWGSALYRSTRDLDFTGYNGARRRPSPAPLKSGGCLAARPPLPFGGEGGTRTRAPFPRSAYRFLPPSLPSSADQGPAGLPQNPIPLQGYADHSARLAGHPRSPARPRSRGGGAGRLSQLYYYPNKSSDILGSVSGGTLGRGIESAALGYEHA
jgi:hypothetical protein